MSFRLVPKSVTLNGIMAIILHYFTEFGSFRAHCVNVVDFSPPNLEKLKFLMHPVLETVGWAAGRASGL